MIDHVETSDTITISITDPDRISRRPGVKHAIHFHVDSRHETTVSLTSAELYQLYQAVEDRVVNVQLERLARLSELA